MIDCADRADLATLLHAPERGRLELLRDTLIVAGEHGDILGVHSRQDPDFDALLQNFTATGTLLVLREGQYLLPGLVDLHVHAPQWPQLGLALELPLEDWLQTHTFPLDVFRYDPSRGDPDTRGYLSYEIPACFERPRCDG